MVENNILKTSSRENSACTVFVFGSGDCAQRIVNNLTQYGVPVHRSSAIRIEENQIRPEMGSIYPSMAELVSCHGFAGEFRLQLKQNGSKITRQAAAVVIAEDDRISPNYNAYGLNPGRRVLALSDLEEKIGDPSIHALFAPSDKVVFLNGWHSDSHPAVAERMLATCSHIQADGQANTFFFANNLKVSSDGAEITCEKAKALGTVFIKNGDECPRVAATDGGAIAIEYLDEVAGTPFSLIADWVIVDEHHAPSEGLQDLADGLGLFRDAAGFVQSDNVHRINNTTNRRGMFVAGGARGVMSKQEQAADADQVAFRVLAFLNGQDREPLPAVEIHRGRCARCLTCFRLCPHKAIDYGFRVTIKPEACFGCGICAAGCPARAIDIHGVPIESELDRFFHTPVHLNDSSSTTQRFVIFGCSRSAGRAYEMAVNMGAVLPSGMRFVEVPCGGTISSRHLLAAFDGGADGVMLCTCHTDNCKSEIGNRLARRAGAHALKILETAGVERGRMVTTSIAANMGREFCKMIEDFAGHLQTLSHG